MQKTFSPDGIRNVVFDLGGVIVGLDSQRCIDAFLGIGADAIAHYVEHHLTEDLFLGVELGTMTTHEFCDEVRQRTHCTAPDERIVWAWNQLLDPIDAAKVERIASLGRSHRVFLLSNTNEMHWLHCARHLFPEAGAQPDALFEQTFLSYKLQLAKPDAAIFQTVLQRADLAPAETLFIDDNADNCAAAHSLGIHTLHEQSGTDWLHALPTLSQQR